MIRLSKKSDSGRNEILVNKRRMSTMSVRNGSISMGTLLGIIISALIIFGSVLYFGSDVYRTKANSAVKNFSEWTPENIAKSPLDYLDFCEKQTTSALEKLKASEIAIAQKKSKIESMRDETKELVDLGNSALEELKQLYKVTASNKGWPASWRGTSLTEENCKKQIVKINKDLQNKSSLLDKYNAAVDQLAAQASKVLNSRDLAKEQAAKISTNREMLKIQEITSDLTTNLVEMKGVIETSVVAVASEDAGSLSLEDLKTQSTSVVSDDDFNKIMSK